MNGNQILYVEDDKFLGQWVEYELTSEGFELQVANDAESGLKAATAAKNPDLILLDVQLPGMSGFQICRILRSNPETAGIPILFLTARDTLDDKLTGLEAGGVDYLTKPFSIAELKARVHAQLRHRENVRSEERLSVDHEIQATADIQQSIMTRTVPEVDGLDISARADMAKVAGGDFYDFQELPDGQLYLLDADVSGKGLPAALLMSATRSVLRAAASELTGPHHVLTRVNEQLYGDLTSANRFVTLFMGLYSPHNRQLRHSSAGHSAAIYRPSNGKAMLLEPANPPIGVLDDHEYTEEVLDFGPGDLLVICSDGFLEAVNTAGDMFGLEHFIESVSLLGDGSAQQMSDTLFESVSHFALGMKQFDDQSLVIIKGV